MKRSFTCTIAVCILAILPVFSLAAPLNVLMIAIDDYNDWSGYLKGHPQVRTPNLDAFASQSVRFTQAYCNSPSCNPSRGSLLMGKYPNSTGLYSNQVFGAGVVGGSPDGTIDLRYIFPKAVTIPQYFKANGYNTYRTGKIFHMWGDNQMVNGSQVDLSFEVSSAGSQRISKGSTWHSGINFIYDYCDWGSFDQPYPDFGEYSRATIAIEYINRPHPKPFFIACGFYLPHLPWYYPKKILDEPGLLHIKNVGDVMLPKLLEGDLNDLSQVAKELAHSADSKPTSLNGNIKYASWHQAINANGKWKEAIQAYIASIYFVDMQIGRLMEGLEKSPYKDNTVVVLWSDHGWLLGQKEAWSKYKPWQQSVRSNLIFKAPGIAPAVVDRAVSHIDIYPTLCDLAGIPPKKDLDGRVLTPLLKNPTMDWDYPAITAHINSSIGGWQSVRTQRYTYIRYYTANNEEELYDRSTDSLEWYNLAGKPEFASVKAQLRAYTPAVFSKLGIWDTAKVVGTQKVLQEKELNPGALRVSPHELRFSLKNAKKASLAVYDLKGSLIRNFSKTVQSMSNGDNRISLNSQHFKPGTYVVRFCDGSTVEISASLSL